MALYLWNIFTWLVGHHGNIRSLAPADVIAAYVTGPPRFAPDAQLIIISTYMLYAILYLGNYTGISMSYVCLLYYMWLVT